MITYVELKNFKSFRDTRFDFRKGKKSYKKFVAVYGENVAPFFRVLSYGGSTANAKGWISAGRTPRIFGKRQYSIISKCDGRT